MDRDVINNLKSLSIDMINNAKSGHPGIALDAAPILYTLYAKYMNINVNDPKWINRDRFILSSGHGSSLLYATLFMTGYDISLDDLKNFRHIGITPGHPEIGITPGVEVSTGPLGTGFATGVGIALSAKIQNKEFSLPKKSKLGKDRSLIDYTTYILCGDGDIMEGITNEAASLAGTWKLDNLVVLYDSNHITLDGTTTGVMDDDILDKFKAMGWYTDYVKDGDSVADIDKAISKAKEADKPALVMINTTIGKGSNKEGTSEVHGGPLDSNDIEQLKMKLNVPLDAFFVNNEGMQYFRKQITERVDKTYLDWANNYQEYKTTHIDTTSLDYLFGKFKDFKIPADIVLPNKNSKEELRVSNNYLMNKIAGEYSNFIGGSADLVTSTKTYLDDLGDINYPDYKGRNIRFGVRENAMGSILNGMALCNYKPFGSTYLVFSDYMRPSIRMSALMHLPVTYIFTHDSVNIGEDGPTHQPIEELSSLRSIPNMKVYRPADINELIGCWYSIMTSNTNPSSLILPKGEVSTIDESNSQGACFGGYVIHKEHNMIHATIIATGTEVHTAINIANELYEQYKLDLRVVSMPSKEVFLHQPIAYQESVIPKGNRNIVIEAGTSFGWGEFVYNDKYLITIDRFGISGTKNEVLRELQFDYEDIKAKIEKLLLK